MNSTLEFPKVLPSIEENRDIGRVKPHFPNRDVMVTSLVHNYNQPSQDEQVCALSLIDNRGPGGAASPVVRVFHGQDPKNIPDFLVAPETVAESNRSSVLVVDDNELHLALVVRIVVGAGFEAHTAEDGEQAWDALTKSNYDLLITDHEMPKLKGLDLIERVRTVSESLPCILISGCPPEREELIKELVYPGAFLAKPFSIRELIETISSVLGRGPSQAF